MEKSMVMVLVLGVALFVSGCGRKGDPLPPQGEEKSFPLTYPAPDDDETQETSCS